MGHGKVLDEVDEEVEDGKAMALCSLQRDSPNDLVSSLNGPSCPKSMMV